MLLHTWFWARAAFASTVALCCKASSDLQGQVSRWAIQPGLYTLHAAQCMDKHQKTHMQGTQADCPCITGKSSLHLLSRAHLRPLSAEPLSVADARAAARAAAACRARHVGRCNPIASCSTTGTMCKHLGSC